MTDLMFQDPKGLVNRAAFNARFSVLNELYRYWWKRIGVNGSIIKSDITAPVIIGDKSAGVSISYGTDLKIKSDGSAEIVDPIEYKTTWISSDGAQEAAETLTSFAPCYLRGLTGDPGNIYYLPNGATYGKEFDLPLQTISYQTSNVSLQVDGVSVKAQKVSVSTEISDWEYVFSDSRNAYPDFGEKDGYEYQYLGVPFENARESTKISIGSYIGTGKYGKSNPNRIVTGFKVRMLMIFQERDSAGSISPYNTKYLSPVFSYGSEIIWFISPPGSTAYFVSNCRRLDPENPLLIKMDFNDDNVSWYVVSDGIPAGNVQSGDIGQYNRSGITYHYLALG